MLGLRLRFIFYIQFVSTRSTLHSHQIIALLRESYVTAGGISISFQISRSTSVSIATAYFVLLDIILIHGWHICVLNF